MTTPPTLPTAADVHAARGRLREFLTPTSVLPSEWLSSVADATVHLSLESLQRSGSFKIRGALNAVGCLRESGSAPPAIVTASAGNHGRALALATEAIGIPLIVFTPVTAPETKKAAIRRHGAILHDDAVDYDGAEAAARAFAASEDAVYISPYNHADVIAGQGTSALDLLDAVPDVDTVFVPIGGGGLASGVGLALKDAVPEIRLVGVEVAASSPFTVARARGAVTPIVPQPSLADGLTGNLEPGSITVPLVQRTVDDIVTVTEDELARAMRGLAGEEHLIAEGAGATAVAAVLAGKGVVRGETIGIIVSGSNIDLDVLTKVLNEGAARGG
ncbi:MAG: threonine/serine dehydratase [Vicinamibacterales bacterium]